MKWTHLTAADYTVSRWSGGTTTQVAIAPRGAAYGDRSFLWRVSSAAVELEESDFTPLPDYHRWIAALLGELTLSHNGGERLTLAPLVPHRFDGGAATHAWGRCTDFNLMLRKGRADGRMTALRLPAGTAREFLPVPDGRFPRTELLLYCAAGTAAISGAGASLTLSKGEAALLEHAEGHALRLEAMESTALLAAEIWS